MRRQKLRWLGQLLIMLLLIAAVSGCLGGDDESDEVQIPRNAVGVPVVVNAGAAPWVARAAADFNAAEVQLSNEQQAFVVVETVEAGQAAVSLADGELEAALWIPDDRVWVAVLADQGNNDFAGDCVSVAESPLVIGMWRPVAEALGWPGRPLGWLDIGSLAADESAWGYYSGGQFGESLRLGHTHPGLSGTGASTLLAIVQAAESQQEAVTVTEIEQPIVQASVGAFEAAVSWFSPDTQTLAQTMGERGVRFLGAAVMYESSVAQLERVSPEIVPLYPFEGTYVATHPACLNGGAAQFEGEGAELFREYLLGVEGQQTAAQLGYRPVNDAVAVDTEQFPLLDLEQPEIVFEAPTLEALYAAQGLWQTARKPVNLVMLLDTSGSMSGEKMENMRAAAVNFVEQMGGDDTITVIAFANTPEIVVRQAVIGQARAEVVQTIQQLEATGNTTLYDAIGEGSREIMRYGAGDVAHAMIVLSDGEDTASVFYPVPSVEMLEGALAQEATVFTIAYGDDADETLLEDIALQGNGNFYVGDEASIDLIYEEMSAAFGGAVGIGR